MYNLFQKLKFGTAFLIQFELYVYDYIFNSGSDYVVVGCRDTDHNHRVERGKELELKRGRENQKL